MPAPDNEQIIRGTRKLESRLQKVADNTAAGKMLILRGELERLQATAGEAVAGPVSEVAEAATKGVRNTAESIKQSASAFELWKKGWSTRPIWTTSRSPC